MCGRCSRRNGADVENGRIASPCCVEQWGRGYAGYGTLKITSGRRCTRNSSGDGSMWIRAKRRGIIRGCMLKVSLNTPSTASLPFDQELTMSLRLGQENVLLHRLLHRRRNRRHPPLRPQRHHPRRRAQQVPRRSPHLHPERDQANAPIEHGQG